MRKINNIINDLLLLVGTVIAMMGAVMLYIINYQLLRLIVITTAILILIKLYICVSEDKKRKGIVQDEKGIYRKEIQKGIIRKNNFS